MGNNKTENAKKAENKIRDLINLVSVLNEEELAEGEGKKIEDDAALQLKSGLQELAKLLAG